MEVQGFLINAPTIRSFYKSFIHRVRDGRRCCQVDIINPLLPDFSYRLASEIANRLMQRLRKAKFANYGYYPQYGYDKKQWSSHPLLLDILWDHLYKEGIQS